MRLYSFYALFMSFYQSTQSTPVTCQGEYGVSADVFSFGILLHEMLSGVRRIFFILFSKDVSNSATRTHASLSARTGALWGSQRSGSVFGHHGWPGSPRRSRMKLRCRKAAGDPMTLTLANSRTEKVDSVDCGKLILI